MMKRKQLTTGLLVLTLAILLMLQYKVFQQSDKYVGLSDIAALQRDLVKEEAEIAILREQVAIQKEQVESIISGNDVSQIEDLLLETKRNLETISGLTNVTGEGIIVIVTDGEGSFFLMRIPIT